MGINWEELLGEAKREAKPPAPPTQPPQPPAPPSLPSIAPPTPSEEAKISVEELLKPKEAKAETKIPEDLLTEEPSTPSKEVWLIFGDKGCLAGDTKIATIDGEKTIGEMYMEGRLQVVLSLDKDLKPVYKLAIPVYTGKQEVYEVLTTHGSIVASAEQIFYTLDGPKALKELRAGDTIVCLELGGDASGSWKGINAGEGVKAQGEDTEGKAWQALERWLTNKHRARMPDVREEVCSAKDAEVLLKQLPGKVLHKAKQSNEEARVKGEAIRIAKEFNEIQAINATAESKSDGENKGMVEEVAEYWPKLPDIHEARGTRKILSEDEGARRMVEAILQGASREAPEQVDGAEIQEQVGAINGWPAFEDGPELQVAVSSKVGDWSEVCGLSSGGQASYRDGWTSLPYTRSGYAKRSIVVEGRLQCIAVLSRRGNEQRIAEEASKALNAEGSRRIKASLADVLEVRRIGVLDTYDLHVLDTHTYIANGFITHNTGKTTTALSFPGEILVLSFDRKSAIIKHNMFNDDPRIHVFDIVKYMDYTTPESMVASAEKTFNYLNALLDNYTTKYPQPDWVVIDGAQIFQQIAEWTMRYRHNLGPFDGIANLNLWKERRMYIRQIHNKALNLAKRGVIYSTYVEKDEVVIKGEIVTRKDTPAWIDVLIYETDYVLYTYYDESKKTYHVRVLSSKNDKRVKSGLDLDVTAKPFGLHVNWG
jgi:hypothetical protein